MRKNNTSIDIVAFGDLSDENLDKLRAFNDAAQGGDGSHLEIVPPGPNLLSDSIVASPILAGEGGSAAAGGGGGGAGGEGGDGFEFGIDPSVDPELALALRMSLEEDRARQERERKAQEEAEGKTKLEGVPEEQEGGEDKPLLNKDLDSNGDPAGSAAGEASTEVKRPGEKKDRDGDDEMDIA